MKLGRYSDFCKIVPNVPFDTFKPDKIGGTVWSLPDSVETRSKRPPCLTTPALWEDGRSEPKQRGNIAPLRLGNGRPMTIRKTVRGPTKMTRCCTMAKATSAT